MLVVEVVVHNILAALEHLEQAALEVEVMD
jgi:hypothetical protein